MNNLEHTLNNVQYVLELLDSRNPKGCIDNEFRDKCKKQKVQLITVLTRTDTVSPKNL